jgi:FeS assembly SUF system protein
MATKDEILQLEQEILQVLKNVYDPEIPVNIYDLGLIYEINVDAEKNVVIKMTLTAPNCPIADVLLDDVKNQVTAVPGVASFRLDLVFEPPWNKDMMSEEARLELGFL